jgi:hypothetical protein
MAIIEEAIRTMLTTGSTLSAAGVPDERVTHGYRLQESALPAVTFEVQAAMYGELPYIRTATVVFTVIDETTIGAGNLVATLKGRFVDGTYESIKISGIVVNDETLNPPAIGMGDEQEPAMATINTTIYWSL